MISSNKLFLLSFSMQFFSKDDRFRKLPHWPLEAAALVSQVQIRLFFSDAAPVLQDSFCAFDDFPGFECPLHFQCFGYQARILKRERRLAGDGLRKPNFFGSERSYFVRKN